ncbi:hypothetical protein D0A40_02680 [Xanthomonas campestris pv. raphani]|nr:hypothetical protein D0A40_02680 [Xanthomonas campestris pv. raphani]
MCSCGSAASMMAPHLAWQRRAHTLAAKAGWIAVRGAHTVMSAHHQCRPAWRSLMPCGGTALLASAHAD